MPIYSQMSSIDFQHVKQTERYAQRRSPNKFSFATTIMGFTEISRIGKALSGEMGPLVVRTSQIDFVIRLY